jgi:hypothetical protein
MGIRDRIRQKIEEHDLTVQGASLAAGLGQTTLRDYLDDPDRDIRVKTLEKLAPVLKTSTKWLHTGEDGADPELAELHDIWDYIPRGRRKSLVDVAKGMATKRNRR